MKSWYYLLILLFFPCFVAYAEISKGHYDEAYTRIDTLANKGLVDTGFVVQLSELQDKYAYDSDIFSFLSDVRHYASDIHWDIKPDTGDVYLGYKYVKKGQIIFFDRYQVIGANANTFDVISKNYAQDNSCVYYQMNCVWYKDEFVWEHLGNDYSVYGGVLYFQDKAVTSDTLELSLLGDAYVRAGETIYYAGRPMDFDAESFVYLGDGMVKDRDSVYYNNAVHPMDPDTAVALGGDYAQDAEHVYFYGQEMPYDRASFDVMPLYEHYVADKNGVYFDNILIEGANPQTFKVHDYPFAQDAHHVYERNQKIARLDATCFEVIDAHEGLIKDCNGLYKRGQRHEGSLIGRVKNLRLRLWSKLSG